MNLSLRKKFVTRLFFMPANTLPYQLDIDLIYHTLKFFPMANVLKSSKHYLEVDIPEDIELYYPKK